MTCTCGADLAHAAEYARQRGHVFEVPEPTMVVTEHQIVALSCGCGQVTLADAPVGVSGRVQYGPTVKAAAVYARGAHFLPFGRAARLLGDLCGAQVSTGFVHTVFTDAARRLGPFLAWLRDLLRAQPVLHADETPARVDGGSSTCMWPAPTPTPCSTSGAARPPTSTPVGCWRASPAPSCAMATPPTSI